MHQRRTGLLALLVVVTIAVAAWWLWNLDAGGTPRANVDAAAEAAPGKAAPNNAAPITPAANAPATTAPETLPDPETKPEAKPEAASYDEPATTPVYGDLLKRGGAVVTFDLRDAQGQWLIDEPVTTRLIRKLGRYAHSEDCRWSFDNGTVVCDGESSAGLEPGTYELEVVASYYGWLRHTFTVQRGEKARFELRLPYWRRIVTCHFNDPLGNPLPFLPSAPRVETTKSAPPEGVEHSAPGSILREPPTPDWGRGGKGGFAYRRARGGGGSVRSVWVTDGGKWHVAVYAGAANKVSAESIGAAWPGENLVAEGTFDGANDSVLEFRVSPPADYETVYKDSRRYQAGDPGQRGLLAWAERKGAHLSPAEPADVGAGMRRLLVTVNGAQSLAPWFAPAEPDEQGQLKPAPAWATHIYVPARTRAGQWFHDIPADSRVWMRLWDGAGFLTAPELIETTQQVTALERAIHPMEAEVLPWLLPPTVDGWAIHRGLELSEADGNRSSRDGAGGENAVHDLARPRLLLPQTETPGEDPSRICATWQLAGEATRWNRGGRPFGDGWIPHWAEGGRWAQELDREQVLPLLLAGAQGPAPKAGLYFRAVDASGAGLPWVEATLHTLEDDARAQRLRDLERRGHKDGWRPNLSTSFANAREEDPSGLSDDDLQREKARKWVGEDFERECKDDADLKFYLRTGAWYDSYTRLRSGEYGYHIDLERRLTPGRKYVLYLWSNSRDDLHPDARFVFQAAEVTDLGVITLPAYTE